MLLATNTGGRLLVLGLRSPTASGWPLKAAGRRLPSVATMNTWPDPVSQQTIHEFLDEINYFKRPTKFVDVGLESNTVSPKSSSSSSSSKNKSQHTTTHADHKESTENKQINTPPQQADIVHEQKIDHILQALSRDTLVPELDYDDALLEGERVIGLATTQGIFRDLFGNYQVDRDDIGFTQAQAERLDKFVPFYWITDQPFARVVRHPKQTEPVKFFKPLVRVSAKFIHQPSSINPSTTPDEHLYAHTSYYGNHIPASEALQKPSIALDCHLLSAHLTNQSPVDLPRETQEKHFDNWTPGLVQVLNHPTPNSDRQLFYSLLMLNLDYLHTDNNCNLHWFAANIQASQQENAHYDELCDYLPVHGVRGFGYSRYVFLLVQHDAPITSQKINGFSLEARQFNLNSFMQEHQSKNITPIGLSWFQTTWDESSNSIFHDYVNIKAPVFEHVQPSQAQRPAAAYPGRIPFNIYLDHYRSKKDINQQVLLERLKQVDPFDYKDQYEVPKVPPTIHRDDEQVPSWMKTVLFKKKNKIGYWRGLRPASATLPLNNNVDLDYPIRPVESSSKNPPEFPNEYQGKPRKKLVKDMPISKPVTEFTNVFIQDDHEVHLEKVMKIMEEAKFKKATQSKDKTITKSP